VDGEAACRGQPDRLGHQPRLPDAGLPDDGDDLPGPTEGCVQRPREQRQLGPAPD
jgi:hypothetical protein